MTAIARVETIPFRIPLRREVRFATGSLSSADHVLVRITDADGVQGIAEAIPRPMIYGETVGSVLSAYADVLEPLAIGASVWSVERVVLGAAALTRNETAKAALELAWLDLMGNRLGTPASRLLGGYTDVVSVTSILGWGEPQAVAEEAREQVEAHGFRSFKVKVGSDLPEDVARCEAVREVVGTQALIYVDANHGYDARTALDFCSAAADLGLAWIEEPSPAEHLLDRERVVRDGGLAVLADESVISAADVARETLARRADMVSLKVARSGWRESDRIRGFCAAAGVPIVMGSQGDSGIGTLGALAYAAAFEQTSRLPAELTYFLHLRDDLLAEPLSVSDGVIHVPDAPGVGLQLDEEKVRRYAMS